MDAVAWELQGGWTSSPVQLPCYPEAASGVSMGGGRGHAPPECRLNLGFQLWYTANLCRLVLTDKLEFWWFSRRRSRLKRQKAGLDPCLAVLQIKTIMPYNRCLRLSSSGFYSPAVQSRHLAKDLGIISSNLKESDHCQLLGYFATKQIRWLNALWNWEIIQQWLRASISQDHWGT